MKKITAIGLLALLATVALPASAKPSSGEGVRPHAVHNPSTVAASASSPVNINTADTKVLSTLKGIGPKKAKAIVDYRQKHGNFKSLQDLAEVRGIGEKSLDRIIKNNPDRLVVK